MTSAKRPRSAESEAASEDWRDAHMSEAEVSTTPNALTMTSAAMTPVSDTTSLENGPGTSKADASMDEETSHDIPAKTSWPGWAELENDPTIFSVMLQEWGVQDVQVREVVPLDALFDVPAASTYGLIFLSRYVPAENMITVQATPPELWFANQTSSFSCATVALMNIINNRNDVPLGEPLQGFKSTTAPLSCKDRGLALDKFDHVRNVHNSFAAEIDMMTVDYKLKADALNSAKRKKQLASQKSKRRKGRKKARKVVDEEEENGFHFISYVPAYGRIWKMDGMERRPQSVGLIDNDASWLDMVVPDLQMQWEGAAQSELEFSLLSLVKRQGGDTVEKDKDRAEELDKATRLREDWGPMMAGLVKLHAEKGTLEENLWG